MNAEEGRGAEESGELELGSLSEVILGCAIQVQRALGSGLLEGAYEACLVHELESAGLSVQRQVPIDITYGGMVVPGAYRLDLLVEDLIVLELKTVDHLTDLHSA